MKITIENYGTIYSVETKHDDVNFEEFMDILANLTGVLFSKELWNEYFVEQ